MKKNLLLVLSLVSFITVSAQNFTGQWKGEFIDKSTASYGWGGDRCDYVLELECDGNKVSGASYTYFNDGGKKYYTICKLEGFLNKNQKYIEVRETERTKTNVPANIRNCFQVHKLTYFKHGDTATIEGKWEPAPNQSGGCGFGVTVLNRRELKQNYPNFNSKGSSKFPQKEINTNTAKVTSSTIKNTPTTHPPVKKTIPNKNTAAQPQKGTPNKEVAVQKQNITKKELVIEPEPLLNIPDPGKIIAPSSNFEKRNNTLLKTIEVNNKTVKVDLYDNGEVDGDSISLIYNGKLLLSHKRLSEKSISLNITVDDDSPNELVMYAENLGTIPPNTALMVVTDGPNRYEVRITSDLQKSGVINFIHKPAVAGK